MELYYTYTPVKLDERPKAHNTNCTLGLANHNIKPFLDLAQLIV